MANEPKDPSNDGDDEVDVDAGKLTPEDLEKIAAGRASGAWNVSDFKAPGDDGDRPGGTQEPGSKLTKK